MINAGVGIQVHNFAGHVAAVVVGTIPGSLFIYPMDHKMTYMTILVQ